MVCGVSIRKDSLNDHPTSQAKGLILRVHTEWITDTLCGHSSSEGSKINESTREAGARVVYTAHFRPPATGGPSSNGGAVPTVGCSSTMMIGLKSIISMAIAAMHA